MYYVYIIKSIKNNTYYSGLAKDLSKRMTEHNSGKSAFTKTRMPWELKWYCAFSNKEKAAQFEKYLKSGSGNAFFKKRLV